MTLCELAKSMKRFFKTTLDLPPSQPALGAMIFNVLKKLSSRRIEFGHHQRQSLIKPLTMTSSSPEGSCVNPIVTDDVSSYKAAAIAEWRVNNLFLYQWHLIKLSRFKAFAIRYLTRDRLQTYQKQLAPYTLSELIGKVQIKLFLHCYTSE